MMTMSRKDTDKLIMTEFGKLYEKRTITQVSVKEIVANFHINRTTFYKHFYDVYDVRDQMENQFIDNFTNTIKENFQAGFSIENVSYYFVKILESNDPYFNVLLKSPDSYHTIDRLTEKLESFFRAQMAIHENEMTDYILNFYISGLCSMLIERTRKGKKMSSEQLGGLLETILTKGMYVTLEQYN